MKKCFYATFAEALQATQALGITTLPEYQQRYREDPRLPSAPNVTYAADWQSWPTFLGTEKTFYASLAEAQQATQALGITSVTEYPQCRREDPRLPASPDKFYATDWQSWPQFLGTADKFYPTLDEAQQATQALGIISVTEYPKRRREDPRLPAKPHKIYVADWQSWPQFLGTAAKFYPTYAEAQQATQALGIISAKEYPQHRREDPRLPASPHKFYATDWQSWPQFLGTADKFYPTLAQALQATQALGVTSREEYQQRRREDPRLPANPNKIYTADWQSWPHFLGKEAKNFYTTYAEAQQATQALGITSVTEYLQCRREDPRLPASPDKIYVADWQSWPQFLGTVAKFYPTLDEAQQATQALGIISVTEYPKRRREDPRLPAKPHKIYVADWQSWPQFLGTAAKFYPNLDEAQQATQALSIISVTEYPQRRREDPLLPAKPDKFYATDWQSWPQFLGTADKFYPTLDEAQQATQALGVTSREKYPQRRREDPRLPANPHKIYAADWQSWPHFFGKEDKSFYATLAEALQATQALGIRSGAEYQQRYREDPRLPSAPNLTYADDWQSWTAFLLPNRIDTLGVLKNACKVLGIRDSRQYRQIQKNYAQLPSKPDKKFKDWIDWYNLLDIPKPYELHELKKIIQLNQCTSLAAYKNLRSKLNDPKMPASPIEYYEGDGWTNTFDFFGVKRPYQVRYFEPKWKRWGDLITEFLKTAKGGDTKVKDLCEFV